ncbi:cell division protein FtsB [Pedobacter cryoconitis]|uniref:Cell division protein FtsB n=1 Tax=Pedobacter cryoconitis TaxID=188932 RepID=A0A7W8ZK16_9SPHI|nr:hypothetical protein [Pedobacter cryoconitis]MBB5635297.1 cell division protein FtsB [Pedobacter cryoconitis]MBB6274091.1 cell division protein FtsB [Pedobacter cryoconitis]
MRIYLIIVCFLLISQETFAQKNTVPTENVHHWWSNLYFILAFVGGCMITAAIQFAFRKGSVNHFEKQGSEKLNNRLNLVVDDNKRLKKENRDLEAECRTLRLKFDNPLVEELAKDDVSNNNELPVYDEKPRQVEFDIVNKLPGLTHTKESLAVLYFPNPNLDGEFKNSEGSNSFIEGASIYKFSLKSSTEAYFEFCEDRSAVSMALNHRNESILAVAQEANAYNSGATKIASDQRGEAVLEGANWIVKNKAKIKYI